MIKHWRLFDTINTAQVRQLQAAKMAVKISESEPETLYDITGSVQKVLLFADVFISTTSDKQDTILQLMFPGKIMMIAQEEEDGYGYRYH